MTSTTVTHSDPRAEYLARQSPPTLAALARRGEADAWQALTAKCKAPTFDRGTLPASLAGYRPRWSLDDAQMVPSASKHAYIGTDLYAKRTGIGTRNGRTFTVTVTPGAVRLITVDQARAELARQRVADSQAKVADAAAAFLLEDGSVPVRVPSRVILEWSAKSRVNMLRRFASIDWTSLNGCPDGCAIEHAHRDAWPLGMLTLTYPRNWLAFAPAGRDAKRQLAAFRQRFGRLFGRRLDGGWKLEFQRARLVGGSIGQEAPHFHLLIPVPPVTPDGERFEAWAARTWADIVAKGLPLCDRRGYRKTVEYLDHRDHGTSVDFAPTAQMSDPKRLAVYFLKHGTKAADGKEYQHNVPSAWIADLDTGEVLPEAGPGRFWGFWGLDAVQAAVEIDVSDFTAASRILRKVANARSRATAYSRAKHDMDAALPFLLAGLSQPGTRAAMAAKYRRARSFNGRHGGFVIVNDGPRLAADLGRALALMRASE